jgi:replication factor A1
MNSSCSAAPAARMGISRRVYPLVSLNPYQGNWTIKVRVTNKGSLRSYKNARGDGSVFNVELTDEDVRKRFAFLIGIRFDLNSFMALMSFS